MYTHSNFYAVLTAACQKNGKGTVIFNDREKISYSSPKHEVETVAAYLQHKGVQYGDKVILVVSNSPEFITTYSAITSIGAVTVPLNVFLKGEEFSYILNDCDARFMFASAPLAEGLKNTKAKTKVRRIIWIGEIKAASGEDSYFDVARTFPGKPNLSRQPSVNDLAHIIYTSGTTGHPKGTLISYSNLFSNLSSVEQIFQISQKDRFVVPLPMFRSFTLTAMVLLPIYQACSIILVKSVFPLSSVSKQVLLKCATIFLGVPAIYTAISKTKIPWYLRWFNRARLFISGGAPLAGQTIDDFKAKFPRAKLLEGYGLSECSPVVAVSTSERQKTASVGVALPGLTMKAVDDELVEVPCDEVGELIIKGSSATQGYLNMPDVTDETVVNDWLKTGDFVIVDEDGFVFIIDRKKDLIIPRGQNAYPREIEEAIYKLDAVEVAVVIGVKDQYVDEEIIASIQLKEGMKLEEAEVRSHLRGLLTNFKIPKQITFQDELPYNATGKVLKRKLKEQLQD